MTDPHFEENTKDEIVISSFIVMNLALMCQNHAVAHYFDTVKKVGERLKFFDLDMVNIAAPKIGTVPFRSVVLEDIYETNDVTFSREYAYLKSVDSPTEF